LRKEEKMKRFVVLAVCGIITLVLIPILAVTATEESSESDVIARAADDYLNDPDTVLNTSSKDLLIKMLGDEPYILSIRSSEDYVTGHIPGAINMSAAELFDPDNLARLPKDKTIHVYCYTGHTASQVTALLNLYGYDATNITWGIMGWTKDPTVATKQFSNPTENLPTETTSNELTTTYNVPTLDNTDSDDKSEIIRAASDGYASAGLKNIAASALHGLITDADPTNDPIIVSVRGPDDYAKGHIPGAVNIPLKNIAEMADLQKLDPNRQIVVYCFTGRTGSQATAILRALGYDAANLLWGISGWSTDPVVAPKRFNPDTNVDYPFETGAGEEGAAASGEGGCG